MDIIKLYQHYNIQISPGNTKHCRPGWVQISCPFCSGSFGYHLGFKINGEYYNCWRCGGHNIIKVFMKILGVSKSEAFKILKQYQTDSGIKGKVTKPQPQLKRKGFKLPTGLRSVEKVSLIHKYLQFQRGFSKAQIKKLVFHFHIQACTPLSGIDKLKLAYRVFMPIFTDKKMTSFQTRDCTGKSDLKYLACPQNREAIDHQKSLYNNTADKSYVVLVEGIFDVWKIFLAGYHSCCCFGVDITAEQKQLIMEYNKIYIWFDPDKPGQKKAKELYTDLLFAGKECCVITTKGDKDPGDMSLSRIQKILNNNRLLELK